MPPTAKKSARQPRSKLAAATVVTLGRLGIDGVADQTARKLLSQPKRIAVLLYAMLAQRSGAVTRDRVIGVFWPESDSARARNALRQTVSFLRGCLGEDTIVGTGTHGLSVAATRVACDAAQFETLLDAGRRDEALQLYGGGFLPGFHLAGSSAFNDWLDSRREYLSQRAAKAAWDLSAECEVRDDLGAAAFWGKRALALSPFSESEVQRLLRLLDRVGDLAGALRAFRGLQESLQAEFGVPPSAETTRLAAAIRQRLESIAPAPALQGPRRTSADRRLQQRRERFIVWKKPERRTLDDRRRGDRRSGVDRRDVE